MSNTNDNVDATPEASEPLPVEVDSIDQDLGEDVEDADPSVPTELLELHVALEEGNMTVEEFEEAMKE